jgi:hypothetical protein
MNPSNPHAGFNRRSACAIFLLAISILLLFNLAILYSPQDDSVSGACTTAVPTRITIANVSIFVNFKNGTVQHNENVTCTRDNVRAVTVFNVMNANYRIAYEVRPNGYLVTAINDAAQGGWTYTIDGTAPAIACNRQPACNGSIIRWLQV